MAGADARRPAPEYFALLAALLLVLSGCSTGDASTSSGHRRSAGPVSRHSLDYVALGDSYTAAPFVSVTDLAKGCFRASLNYPHLVATRLGARLHDVSCGGADTGDITGRQSGPNGTSHPPQIQAVSPRARLVTVGIGGNDGSLFGTILRTCLGWNDGPSATPSPVARGACGTGVRRELGDPRRLIDGIGRHVAAVLDLVHRRAPRADVVLVGYPRLVSADGSCAGVPLSSGDRSLIVGIQDQLSSVLAKAAQRSGTDYVDMHRLSRGHEICSADPWVNGPVTNRNRALAFHPFAAEQRAVAAAVVHLVHPPL